MNIPEHYSRLLKGLFLQRFSFQACPKMDLLSFVKHLIPIPSFSFNRYCCSLVKILFLGQTSSRLSTSCVYTQKMHSFVQDVRNSNLFEFTTSFVFRDAVPCDESFCALGGLTPISDRIISTVEQCEKTTFY